MTAFITNAAYFYLFLPFSVFLAAWVKPAVSLPCLIVLAAIFCRMVKSQPKLKKQQLSKGSLITLAWILLVCFIWAYLAGIGKYTFQGSEYNLRNQMFDLLLKNDWPVMSLQGSEANPGPSALIYCIGSWLPAAAAGKIFGEGFGQFFLLFWTATQLFLFYALFCFRFLKRLAVWPLFIFIAFSGLDIIGYMVMIRSDIASTTHIEWWAPPLQYSGFTTQLFWMFNQAAPAWLAAILMLVQKSGRFLAVLAALAIITSGVSSIGLFLLAIFIGCSSVWNKMKSQRENFFEMNAINLWKWKFSAETPHRFINESLSKALIIANSAGVSFDNVLGGGLIGILSCLYLANGASPLRLAFQDFNGGFIVKLAFFFILEAGAYLFAVYRYQKNNPMFFFCFSALLAIPLFSEANSVYRDFCMRASIPILTVLFALVIDSLIKSARNKDRLTIAALALMIAIGAGTSGREIARSLISTIAQSNYSEDISAGTALPFDPGQMDGFSRPVEGSAFFERFAKAAPTA
ncbi:MAG: hypothetical protein LBU32_12795 [Clostridiales bacterium]|nr:hypothetical protein [Clostridiales bacterium]